MMARKKKQAVFVLVKPAVEQVDAVRTAIADYFCERPEEFDIRPLWDRAGYRTFRVNFWGASSPTGGPTLRRSAFVVAEFCNGAIRVREVG